MNGELVLPPAVGGLLGLLAAWGSIAILRRRRLLRDLPTSKAHGVFMGFVEVCGRATSDRPLTSALAEAPCVWYRWTVEERWRRTVTETVRENGKTRTRTRVESGWTTVAEGGEARVFDVEDETGRVQVDPGGARVEPLEIFDEHAHEGDPIYYEKGPPDAISNSTGERRFHEEAIPLGTTLFVVGQAREREDVVAPEIAHDPAAPQFLITTKTERVLDRRLLTLAWVVGAAGALAGGAAAAVTFEAATRGGSAEAPWLLALWTAVGLLIYGAVWGLGWLWMSYNALLNLRQRVRQAWSLVDVQLQRRADLIPRLVKVVEGLRDHERTLQTEVAHLRGQLLATPPGRPGPDPSPVTADLRAVVERYPELGAHPAFVSLQESLVDTEDRIALARHYFNDIASFYNTRLEIVPDAWVARLAGLKTQEVLGFKS